MSLDFGELATEESGGGRRDVMKKKLIFCPDKIFLVEIRRILK